MDNTDLIEQLEREKAQLLLDMKRISNGTDEVLRPSDKGYIDRRGIRGIARRNLDANLAFLSRIDQLEAEIKKRDLEREQLIDYIEESDKIIEGGA